MDTEKDLDALFNEMMGQSGMTGMAGMTGTGSGISQSQSKPAGATDQRLADMNKKLPAWNLEPPYSALN